MGLQNQLIDLSSESIPIIMLTLIANCVCYLRSVFLSFLTSLGLTFAKLSRPTLYGMDSALTDAVGSGLAGVFILAEQLNLNRVLSYRFDGRGDHGSGSDCVVCLNRLDEGDLVRTLACNHVFHKLCFDGWLHQLNFSCPLCRSPLVAEDSVADTRRRVVEDLCAWFSLR